MKKLFTLAAAGTLAAASLSAQAQITIDGTLGAAEMTGATTTGAYTKLGQYPFAHGFGDAGLLSIYGANSASKVRMFVGGTLQPYPAGNNSFQVFIGLPASTGVPMGTALPMPTTGTTGASTTSFGKFNGKLDQATDLGLAIRTNSTAGMYQVEAVAYRVGATAGTYAASDTVLTATASPLMDNGTALTLPTITRGRFRALSGARMAYKNAPGGLLTANPGYVAPTTSATATPATNYGSAAGTTGWEIELDRTALGLATGNPTLSLFVQQNNNGGDYVSSDYLPNPVFPAAANIGVSNPDYTSAAFAGTQSATFALATVLATKVAAAIAGLNVYPNPIQGASTVTYQVAERASNVNIVLTDLMGRTVRTIENGLKPVGTQTAAINTASLAAGTYLVRVQVGESISTSKVSVQ